MHVNFHFISHLELVKHYHSITVNLKTMKSFGFSRKSPSFLSIALFYILCSKQNFNFTNPKAIYQSCGRNCLWNSVRTSKLVRKNFQSSVIVWILWIWSRNLFQLQSEPAQKRETGDVAACSLSQGLEHNKA